MGDVVGQVGEMWRYPVKSMAGERLDSVELGPLGIDGDRRYALRDVETGKVLSAKQRQIGPALLACRASLNDGELSIDVDGTTFGLDDRDALDAALTARLGRPVRLVSDAAQGDVYESYWPEVEGTVLSDVTIDLPVAVSTEPGTFVDLAPLHVVATSSIEHLADLLPDSVLGVGRFRPSFTVEGAGGDEAGFVEDGWTGRRARVGTATVAFTTASPRCVMTTLGQPGLPGDRAILQTLARQHRLDFNGVGMFACLGLYAEVIEAGTISEGDDVILD